MNYSDRLQVSEIACLLKFDNDPALTRNQAAWVVALAVVLFSFNADSAVAATTEIRKHSNGFWLFINGSQTTAFTGMVYQPTPNGFHIRDFDNRLSSLYGQLDDEAYPGGGGRGHGRLLSELGVKAIRVYSLPINNREDEVRVKGIFRRLHRRYGIYVMPGYWAGLYSGLDLSRDEDQSQILRDAMTLVTRYCREPWILGWQLGNENNYHILAGQLSNDIKLGANEYYQFMDKVAGAMRETLGDMSVTQFVALGQGELNPAEIGLINRHVRNVDAIGINCYRDPSGFEQLIEASRALERPIIISEFGRPADNVGRILRDQNAANDSQGNYINAASEVIFRHAAGHNGSGVLLGAFIHEATDQKWKVQLHGNEADAHYGVFGKASWRTIHDGIWRREKVFELLPRSDAPLELENAAWTLLARRGDPQYGDDTAGLAMSYAERIIALFSSKAESQVRDNDELARRDAAHWAYDAVGTAWFIRGSAQYQIAQDYLGRAGLRNASPDDSERGHSMLTEAEFSLRQCQTTFANASIADQNGRPMRLREAVVAMFPDMVETRIDVSWRRLLLISVVLGTVVLYGPAFLRWATRSLSYFTKRCSKLASESDEASVLSRTDRLSLLALVVLIIWALLCFGQWWFHPVRSRFFLVHPRLFWILTVVYCWYAMFYLYVSLVLWRMRDCPTVSSGSASSDVQYRVAAVTTHVAGEPLDLLARTLKSLRDMTSYPHDTYVLDETPDEKGLVGQECRFLDYPKFSVERFSRANAPEYNQEPPPLQCSRPWRFWFPGTLAFQARTKAGNINAWLDEYGAQYDIVVFFDPDHRPKGEYLTRVLKHFTDPTVGFVQAPVIFDNADSLVAKGASEQGLLFHGPIQLALSGMNCCMINGSHTAIRVSALDAIGRYAVHDADDLLTSIRLHASGYRGVFVPEALAYGLAPTTWRAYLIQQRRWSRSMFSLLLWYYPYIIICGLWARIRRTWRRVLRRGDRTYCESRSQIRPGLTLPQAIAYCAIGAFYFNHVGFIILMALPILAIRSQRTLVNAPIHECLIGISCVIIPYFILLTWWAQRFLVGTAFLAGRRASVNSAPTVALENASSQPSISFWYRAGLLAVGSWFVVAIALCESLLYARRVPRRAVAEKVYTQTEDAPYESQAMESESTRRNWLEHSFVLPYAFCAVLFLRYALPIGDWSEATLGMRLFTGLIAVCQVVLLIFALGSSRRERRSQS